ncbi:Septum formation protein Maf [plant metagenome]|uniref:Septum formation protein Maf n=1 Tax=plant metagenome TaxID=1297885 RepID=A0A484RKC0_9ZZZZ
MRPASPHPSAPPPAHASAPAIVHLASASPRRRELLLQLGVPHEVLAVPAPPGEDEPRLPGESPHAYVCRTAREKAMRALRWRREQGLPALPLLAADTCVSLDDEIFGKPKDAADAARILRKLSNTCHDVRTAVVVAHDGALFEILCASQVWMRDLLPAEIQRYCATAEPYGKAGAYGIQGLAGAFVARLDGSYTGVMGLPLCETAALLARVGIQRP